MSTVTSTGLAAVLNAECKCVIMDDALLDRALAQEGASFGAEQLLAAHPHLFSRTGVFVPSTTLSEMRALIAAVERVVALPTYRTLALRDAHPHAQVDPRALGAFMGFDFHLSDAGPQLIEINTNAGGALLNVLLRRAQRACCDVVADALSDAQADLNARFFDMFVSEWRRARGDLPLRSVVITDDAPESQYLFPEFVLFTKLCEARGIDAWVCDARELEVRDGRLEHRGRRVDLVYNRLTDFALSAPEHAALARAYCEDLAVVTPHPRAHALYADKLRLVTFSDAHAMRELGATRADAELIARHVPRTTLVAEARREELWSSRKQLFFKPQSGYGSKAAYRGDKLTKGVFEQLLREPYVAQALVPPSARVICTGDEARELKLDVRNFAYAGEVQLVCARLYQGQTTNFRTLGGGFAPVYETPT